MQRELIDEESFKKIISNQNLIIQDLDKSYTSMHSFLQLSTKYLPQAASSFKIGQQHITKIRANLDYIHKVMLKIKKKIKSQQEQQKIKSQQINTVMQAMKNVMQQQTKDNFISTEISKSEQLIETGIDQASESLANTLQVDQIQKLMAYYKLDQDVQEGSIHKSQQQIRSNIFSKPGPFVLLSKKEEKQQRQQNSSAQPQQESLI